MRLYDGDDDDDDDYGRDGLERTVCWAMAFSHPCFTRSQTGAS